MKKILSLLLAALMVLSMVACGGDNGDVGETTKPQASGSGKFEVGYGAVNITPTQLGVPMSGYGNTKERLSTGFLSYLYAISVVFTDAEGNTAVVMAVDSCSVGEAICKEVRQWAESTQHIPMENIIICSLHQHSTPTPYEDMPTSIAYRQQMTKGMQDSIAKAMEDRAPAEVYINTAETDALNFVRHYIANDPKGSIVGDNYNDAIGAQYGYKGHESEADNEMRMIKFKREGDKKDIIMVNFQAHPHIGTSSKSTDIHSDWPGVMRDEVSKALGCDTIYFSGAGGNLNSSSRIESENKTNWDFKEHGKLAAQYVIDAESSYTKVNTGKVMTKEIELEYGADHSMDHLYKDALVVHDARSVSLANANAVLKKYPKLHSVYHATAVVEKYNAPSTAKITIGAVAFGDVAFTGHPYEMFDTNGMELRAGSANHENKKNYDPDDQLENPYKMTFVISLANNSRGYIPSRLGYTNGGYSTDITYFAPGTGEQLVGDYLRILNELHG